MDVYLTPAAGLDSLVARSLQPSPEFLAAARRALGALAASLREAGGRAAAHPWRVLKIAKVGAAGRGGTPRNRDNSRRMLAHYHGLCGPRRFLSALFIQRTCYALVLFEVP